MTAAHHPLDRLEEARDFAAATRVLEDAARHEAAAPWADDDDRAFWQTLIERARRARAVARAVGRAHGPRSAALTLRAAGLDEFAAALETGDWRSLAF